MEEEKQRQAQGALNDDAAARANGVPEPDAMSMNSADNTPEKQPEPESLGLQTDHTADAADKLEHLDLDEQVRLVQSMQAEDAAEAIVEMEEHLRSPLMEKLDPELGAEIIEEMSPDDAADTLDELEEGHRALLLKHVSIEDAAIIRHLMRYNPESAGGVMNTEIVVVNDNLTADQAIAVVRRDIRDKEVPYYAYLVDDTGVLTGVLSLRDLLTSPPDTQLALLMPQRKLIKVYFDLDKEEVAHLFGHYNFMALPVVDYSDRLLGVVTHDDILDIIHEEASEDMLGMVGAGVDETVDMPWTASVLRRLPWLFVNLLNSTLAAFVVYHFEGTIAQMAILAALMPIVTNQAGNTGQQSLAVIIRQLAMERFEVRKIRYAILREIKIGLSTGLMVGLVVFGLVFAIMQQPMLAMVMAMALGSNMVIGTLAGASIPFVLRRLGRDPAQASSIFLTTITDSVGFFIFLSLAGLILL